MSRAAPAAALPVEGLPDIDCDAAFRTETDYGLINRCTLPAGHLDRDVPHRWSGWQPCTTPADDRPEREMDF